MLKRTEGIVLKSAVFGEADLIVTYLSRDFGLLKVFAKSPRKVKSRFGGSLEPLTHARIAFLGKEHANLPRLTQSDIVRPFHSLREDFDRLLRITELLELNLNFLPEREPHPEVFDLLLGALARIETGGGNGLHYLYYKIKFLEHAGYAPRLDTCGRCGDEIGASGARHSFYLSHGSLLCPGCTGGPDAPIHVSGSALRFYRSIFGWRHEALDRIKAPEGFVSELNNVLSSHIAYIAGAGRTFNRKRFMAQAEVLQG